MPQPLSFEEFAWQCLWLECGRLDQYVASSYTLKKVRELKRRAIRGELWAGPHGDKSEWAGMVRNWYKYYLLDFQPALTRKWVQSDVNG